LVVEAQTDLIIPTDIDTIVVVIGNGELRYPCALGVGPQSPPVRVALVPGGMRDVTFQIEAQGLRLAKKWSSKTPPSPSWREW
jgi:hypothetical protein